MTPEELDKGVANLVFGISNALFEISKAGASVQPRVVSLHVEGKMYITGVFQDVQVSKTVPLASSVTHTIENATTVDETSQTDSTRAIQNGGDKISGSRQENS